MQLVLDDYGICLEKADNLFLIKRGDVERSISPLKITAIHIFKTANLSTAALLMAAEHNVAVIVYDGAYKPAVRLWRSNFTGSGEVRSLQPIFCESAAAVYWSKKLVGLKLTAQLQHAGYIKNRWPAQTEGCRLAEEQISNSLRQIEAMDNGAANLASLRGLEGVATAANWKLLQALLGEDVFGKREQQQPADKFNACINYLYGILYGKVEGALLAYGLDPMVGMMHAEGYSKKSLVYDCIEPFRPWADALAVQLFKSKTLQSEHFEYRESGIRLAKEGRKLLAGEFIKLLNERTVMNNRRISRNDQVFFLCSQLAGAVKNFDPKKNNAL